MFLFVRSFVSPTNHPVRPCYSYEMPNSRVMLLSWKLYVTTSWNALKMKSSNMNRPFDSSLLLAGVLSLPLKGASRTLGRVLPCNLAFNMADKVDVTDHRSDRLRTSHILYTCISDQYIELFIKLWLTKIVYPQLRELWLF